MASRPTTEECRRAVEVAYFREVTSAGEWYKAEKMEQANAHYEKADALREVDRRVAAYSELVGVVRGSISSHGKCRCAHCCVLRDLLVGLGEVPIEDARKLHAELDAELREKQPIGGSWRCDVCGQVRTYPDHCEHYYWDSQVRVGPIPRKGRGGAEPYRVEEDDDDGDE